MLSFSKGKHEDITREYFEAKKRYEGIMESLKNLKRYSKVTLLCSFIAVCFSECLFFVHPLLTSRTYMHVNNNLHLAWKYARYLSTDIVSSETRTVFQEQIGRKRLTFEGQMMSIDKYSNTFSLQMETIVFIFVKIIFETRAFFKIGEYCSDISHLAGHIHSRDASRPIACWVINM